MHHRIAIWAVVPLREVLLQWTIQNERGPALVDEGLLVYKQPFFMKENENMKTTCPTLYYIY